MLDIKSKIHEDVENVKNDKVLEMVNIILNAYNSSELIISEKHKKFLEESDKSKTFTNDEAKKLVGRWLND